MASCYLRNEYYFGKATAYVAWPFEAYLKIDSQIN